MDGLCLKPGPSVRGISSPNVGSDIRTHPVHVSALGRDAGATAPSSSSSSFLKSSFTAPLTSLGDPTRDMRNEDDEQGEEEEGEELNDENAPPLPEKKRRGNWVLKILHIGMLWSKQRKGSDEDKEEEVMGGDHSRCFFCCDGEEEESDGCGIGDELEEIEFDRDSFSRLLTRVSLMEVRVYAKMSYLGSLAYSIPKIKSRNLLEYHGLCFVTSSLEKKAQPLTAEEEKISSPDREAEPFVSKKEKLPAQETEDAAEEGKKQRANGHRISVSSVYQIAAAAAAAASYLHSHTRIILSFRSARTNVKDDSVEGGDHCIGDAEISNSEVASLVATTNSVTAVVAGKEEMKQAVANDLRSAHSSPCEWFICDDKSSGTRFFVIQGSESLASWQANLLFEPIQFEGLDVLVHRGIYEAAKGIYEQFLPEVRAHLKSHGNSATLRFTGHSLGGSLALLVNLMLLIRGEAPRSSLLPVITFGSPSIMCGGNGLLRKLGLPQSHVQAITIHRDVVPRAFSCSYPDHVVELLKAMNRNFRNHPCLNNQKLLYAPMGKFLILQPEENLSPHHHLLPSGSGLYLLGHPVSDSGDLVKLIRAAQTAFLNSPHPLEILSDPSAYGSDGAIYRDHDMNSYMRSVRAVIRQELKHLRKTKREQRRKAWWPLVTTQELHTSVIVDRRTETANLVLHQHPFSTVFQSGRESLKWFSRLVASQHLHLLIVLLFPARLLLLGTLAIVGFH